jgi:hypothetical protein
MVRIQDRDYPLISDEDRSPGSIHTGNKSAFLAKLILNSGSEFYIFISKVKVLQLL